PGRRARPEDGRVQLQPRRQRPQRDLADSGRGQGHRDVRGGRSWSRDRRAHCRQPRQRAHCRGPADLQLGRRAFGRGPAHPPPSHPVGGDRRGAPCAGRQAPARTRLIFAPNPPRSSPTHPRSHEVMSVSVSMPQLGESVTEGTVTRWLKKEGERVEVDEPLLEVSTDKVDTEIPSPASGILRGISVDEDETVAVGAQLAVIDDGASGDAAPGADDSASAAPAEAAQPAPAQDDSAQADSAQDDSAQADSAQTASAQGDSAQADSAQADSAQTASAQGDSAQDDSAQDDSAQPAAAQAEQAPADSDGWSPQGSQPNYAPPAQSPPAASPRYQGSSAPSTPAYAPPPTYGQPAPAAESAPASAAQVPAPGQPAAEEPAPAAPAAAEARAEEYPPPTPLPSAGDAPYVTPLVRKLAAEHAVDLESVTGTGVGGRIRQQDVIEAARAQRAAQPAQPPAPAQPAQPSQPAQPAAQAQAPQPAQPQPPQQARPAQAAPRPAVVPSSLRGTTQRMSRPRQVIAQRMVESLHVSAQLTTVVEADVTSIARLRDQARQDFEAREGVKLSFLPFFALAAVEALKVHPKLNAVIDGDQVTYHDAEHLGM